MVFEVVLEVAETAAAEHRPALRGGNVVQCAVSVDERPDVVQGLRAPGISFLPQFHACCRIMEIKSRIPVAIVCFFRQI